ncbi:hypothetical protein IMY05_C4815000200 [Salix suchowensis]|nr:hypothetical protein IMY05_C4815000200 [Salix suchowensis]
MAVLDTSSQETCTRCHLAPRVRGSRVLDMKEWGTAVDDNEIYDIQELEEFRSFLTRHEHNASSPPRRPLSPLQAEERPRKRLKVEAGPYFRGFPTPYPYSPYRPRDAAVTIHPFSKAKPIILPPHTFTDFVPLPQTRTAWIVPVRGTLPWEGSSSAVAHTSSDPSDLKPFDGTVSGIICRQIMWNKVSLVEFWTFLLTLRDKGTLGSIGISFHTSHSSTRSCTQISTASAHEGYQGPSGSPQRSTRMHPETTNVLPLLVLTIDQSSRMSTTSKSTMMVRLQCAYDRSLMPGDISSFQRQGTGLAGSQASFVG